MSGHILFEPLFIRAHSHAFHFSLYMPDHMHLFGVDGEREKKERKEKKWSALSQILCVTQTGRAWAFPYSGQEVVVRLGDFFFSHVRTVIKLSDQTFRENLRG